MTKSDRDFAVIVVFYGFAIIGFITVVGKIINLLVNFYRDII